VLVLFWEKNLRIEGIILYSLDNFFFCILNTLFFSQNNNKDTSVVMEHFKKFFRHTNNNDTLNLAFIFSDEARYSFIPFLSDIIENQKDFIDFIDQEMVLPKFVLFEPV
jgi:hypothetical protein